MKKSRSVSISFLSSMAALISGCAPDHAVSVHLNASGQCISEDTGLPVDQRICYGYGGGYYRGVHYFYAPGHSAPYYSSPASPGYVHPWGSGAASGSTVRGVFGESAAAHGGESAGHGGGAGE